VLHGVGVTTINTSADAARALEPLVRTFPTDAIVGRIEPIKGYGDSASVAIAVRAQDLASMDGSSCGI